MVGDTRAKKLVEKLRARGWGRVFASAARTPTPYPGEPWVLDNGAFAAWKGGKPFDPEAFAARAWRVAELAPLFGVLPDVVGGGMASLELSLAWLPKLPPSIPWYLAVQDGIPPILIDDVLDAHPRIAGLFLGGTTAFKLAFSEIWSVSAHWRGLKFHYARVSTERHLRRALACGADSCDSTQPLWSAEHWRRFERWLGDNRAQGHLRFDEQGAA